MAVKIVYFARGDCGKVKEHFAIRTILKVLPERFKSHHVRNHNASERSALESGLVLEMEHRFL